MQFFSKYVLILFFACFGFTFSQVEAKEETLSYRVTRNDYAFSTIFDMNNNKSSYGNVVKNFFHIATQYDAYDRFGLYEGQGVCRLSSLGLFYIWATEIDVYNAEGEKVGMIDGQLMSSEPAKFSFYNESEECVAIAYLDKNCMGFQLVHPDNPSFILAQLTRNFIIDAIDNWDVTIFHPDKVPTHLVKIFAAFVCDTQHKFKIDL